MFPHRRLLSAALLLLLAACSSTEDPMSPEPTPEGPPVIESFSISVADNRILHGDFATLRWRAPGATAAAILPPVSTGGTAESGAATVRPYEPTTYTLTVGNAFGTATATLEVDVLYRPGIYVDPFNGDDANSGVSPLERKKSIDAALAETQAGGTIFLTGGTYTTPVTIDAAQVSVYGGLDPVSFFEGDPRGSFVTRIQPTSGIPLSVRNTNGTLTIQNILFDARFTEACAGEIVDAQVRLVNCNFDAREATVAPAGIPAALRVETQAAISGVEARGCRFYGPQALPFPESRGVSIEQNGGGANTFVMANCFVWGGRAISRSSGVWVDSDGQIGIGLSTIGAEITTSGGVGNGSSAVRVLRGAPFLGGSILFTRGSGARYGVLEETVDANLSSLEGNLFISLTTPYGNSGGFDAATGADLQDPERTIAPNVQVGDNILEGSLSVSTILVDIPNGDYHLVQPILLGNNVINNPAFDRGGTWMGKSVYGGNGVQAPGDDIDGDARPASAAAYDLGADED